MKKSVRGFLCALMAAAVCIAASGCDNPFDQREQLDAPECILLDDFNESFSRVNHWRSRGGRFLPHAQPYRDVNNPHHIVPQSQKDLAGWADKKQVFRTCEFKDFEPRKGFRCRQYFDMTR